MSLTQELPAGVVPTAFVGMATTFGFAAARVVEAGVTANVVGWITLGNHTRDADIHHLHLRGIVCFLIHNYKTHPRTFRNGGEQLVLEGLL